MIVCMRINNTYFMEKYLEKNLIFIKGKYGMILGFFSFFLSMHPYEYVSESLKL